MMSGEAASLIHDLLMKYTGNEWHESWSKWIRLEKKVEYLIKSTIAWSWRYRDEDTQSTKLLSEEPNLLI